MPQTLAWLAIVAGVALLTAAITRILSRPRDIPLSEIQELKRRLAHRDVETDERSNRLLASP